MKTLTLSQVASFVLRGSDYASHVKEFLDAIAFYKNYAEAVEDEPALLGGMYDAHLAGIAEHLAFLHGFECPAWTEGESRFLTEPIFSGGKHSREYMIETTSPSMRRRNIFCGELDLSSIRGKTPLNTDNLARMWDEVIVDVKKQREQRDEKTLLKLKTNRPKNP